MRWERDVMRELWRVTAGTCAEAVWRLPALEPPLVGIGRRVWRVPALGRFYRGVAHRLCERLRKSDGRFRNVEVEGRPLTLDVTEFTAGPLYFGGQPYEPQTARCLRERLRPGGVFVDVGANHGYFTLLAASLLGARGRVFAFEPNPAVFAQLEEHVALNRLEASVTALPLALGDGVSREARLFISQCVTNSGLSSLVPASATMATGWLSREASVSVAMDTFDRWLEGSGIDRVDLVKIDVEGAEDRVLRGMTAALARRAVDAIICETVPDGPVHKELCHRGFTPVTLESFGTLSNLLYLSA